MLVTSRIYGLKINGQLELSMVPYADMLNHDIKICQTKWFYDDKRGGFCIQATDNIPRGDQIFLNYGSKSNSNFLLSYGFLDESNFDNFASINVPLSPNDTQLKLKKWICENQKVQNEKCEYFLRETLDHINTANFLSWMRFLVFEESCAPGTDLDWGKMLKEGVKPISMSNELKVWHKIKELCQDFISGYPSTLDEDL